MNQVKKRYWEDIEAGENFTTESITISTEDILAFAAEFDPQPYHLNPEAAADSIFGGLCASGWHVCAVMMRLLTDTFLQQNIDLLGSSGVSSLRWRQPVFAGDSLESTITACNLSPNPLDARIGTIECDVNVSNQKGESVIVLTTSLTIGRERGRENQKAPGENTGG